MKNVRYKAIQIIRNHDCPEPVTVGVFVYFDNEVELRMLGVNEGGLNLSEFRLAFPDLANSDWIYEQWVEWFQLKTARFKWRRAKTLQKFEQLESRGEPVIASISGEAPISDDVPIPTAANQLFDDLVMNSPAMRKARFFASVERLLETANLGAFDRVEKDTEVELLAPNGAVRQLIFFPHLWESSARGRFACKVLWADGSPQQISAVVSDATNAFEVAQRFGFLSKHHCFVFVAGELPARYTDIVSTIATVIHIDAPTAKATLQTIFSVDRGLN